MGVNMPKVYILPEIIIWDKKINTYCHPDVFAKKKYQKVDWREAYKENHFSHQEYILYLDGVELPRKDNRMMSLLTESYLYYGKVNNWGLFSFDITPGEHTLRIEASQESYYKEELLFPFTKNGESCQRIHIVDGNGSVLSPYRKNIARYKEEIKFNVGSSNVYFRFYLEYEQYYPLCHEKRYFYVGGLNDCRHNDLNCWFYYNYVKYAKNQKMSFDQISYATLKGYMDERFKDYSAIVYNEPMPEPSEEELADMNVVKSSTGNGAGNSGNTQGGTANAQTSKNCDTKVAQVKSSTSQSSADETKPMTLKEKAQAAGKSLVDYILDKPDTEPKVVYKDKIKTIKYYETKEFKDSMKDYEYEVLGDEVILYRVINPKKEMVIPNGVTRVTENAFGDKLQKVEYVYLPYSVNDIEKGAFKNNSSIERIKIDSNITCIKGDTFSGCKKLKEVELPPSLKVIEKNAFAGVTLDNAFVPYGVKVEEDAFVKSVNIVQGNKKTLEIMEKVKSALAKEASINVRDEVSKIKEPDGVDYKEIEKMYDKEIAEIEKGNLESLENYKIDVGRFDFTYFAKEKEVEKLENKYNDLIGDKRKNNIDTMEYDRKFNKLLVEFTRAHDVDFSKRYPHIFK